MEFENLEVGNREPTKLEPKPVIIVGISEEDVKLNSGPTKKLVLNCLHPDKKEGLQISKVTYLKDKKLVTQALWLKKDEDGKLPKYSTVAALLRAQGCARINDLLNKTIPTCQDEKGYLALKNY